MNSLKAMAERLHAPALPISAQLTSRNEGFLDELQGALDRWEANAVAAGVAGKHRALVKNELSNIRAALSKDPRAAIRLPASLPQHALNVIAHTAKLKGIEIELIQDERTPVDVGEYGPAALAAALAKYQSGLELLTLENRANVASYAQDPFTGRWHDLAQQICSDRRLPPAEQISLLTDLRSRLEQRIKTSTDDKGRNPAGQQVFCDLFELLEHGSHTPREVKQNAPLILGPIGEELVRLKNAATGSAGNADTYEFNFLIPRRPVRRPAPEVKSPPVAQQAASAGPRAAALSPPKARKEAPSAELPAVVAQKFPASAFYDALLSLRTIPVEQRLALVGDLHTRINTASGDVWSKHAMYSRMHEEISKTSRRPKEGGVSDADQLSWVKSNAIHSSAWDEFLRGVDEPSQRQMQKERRDLEWRLPAPEA